MCRALQELPAAHIEYMTLRLVGLNLRSLPDVHVAAPLLRLLDLSQVIIIIYYMILVLCLHTYVHK
jgi:hypothetical protein